MQNTGACPGRDKWSKCQVRTFQLMAVPALAVACPFNVSTGHKYGFITLFLLLLKPASSFLKILLSTDENSNTALDTSSIYNI